MTVRAHYGRELIGVALFITALLVICLLLVPPTLNVPLNDDWAYAQSVQQLLATGQLHVSNWSTAALIPQIYWGAAFTHLVGNFSFVTLRLSTILFSLVTALALYDLLRQLDLPWIAALLGVLTLIANPLFLNLTYSFMTDVFYLGLMLISLAFSCAVSSGNRRRGWSPDRSLPLWRISSGRLASYFPSPPFWRS